MVTTATDEHTKVWNAALGELEVTITKANFRTWFKKTKIVALAGSEVTLSVPNTFAQEWLSKKYHEQILATLRDHYPDVRTVKYEVSAVAAPAAPSEGETSASSPFAYSNTGGSSNTATTTNGAEESSTLNPNHTFDTFVVGTSNRLAHAVAVAVGKNPGDRGHNPLYFYGGVGLGKTHLIQAIGNEIKRQSPGKTIIYASCEKFTTEFVEALQSKRLDQFKKRYRTADVLLIDDIQFLSGKEGTQEEFFHTFNTLHQTNRQIVMTSDTRPQSIPGLAPRLSSRFGWGMVADIQAPDYETRQAILRAKCDERGFALGDEALEFMAQHVQSNIRDLEGALNNVIGHCELYAVSPDAKLIQRILAQTGADLRGSHLSTESIFQTIAEFFSLELPDLLGKRRHKELVYPRQIAMYLLRNELNYSYPRIGKALGGKDHTTVMHGVEKVTKELKKNEVLQREIGLIKERLYAS